MAGISSWASMLWVKNSGDASSRSGGKNAGAPLLPLLSSMERRNRMSSPALATRSIATRVIGNAVTEDPISQRQIRFQSGRVNVRNSRVRNKSAVP